MKGTSPQTASHVQRSQSPSPRLGRVVNVILDEVDVAEQKKIQEQLSKNLESAYELAIQEALRRSLLTCPENQPVQTDGAVGGGGDRTPDPPSSTAPDIQTDMNQEPLQCADNRAEDTLVLQGRVAPCPAVRMAVKNVGSTDSQKGHLSTTAREVDNDAHQNGMPDIGAIDLNDADDEDDDDVPRSRKSQYKRQQQMRSERRPSLDRLNSPVLERRPSLERMNNPASERRPSLDRMNQCQSEQRQDSHQSERRPSLDRLNNYSSERRPSLDRLNNYSSERRPSLDHLNDYTSERRPSLERLNNYRSEQRASLEQLNDYRSERRSSLDRMERRQSLERRDSQQSERRPSLERVDQATTERRASLDRMQSAAERLHSLHSQDESGSSAQGINTLRPWPLNEMGIPTNWDITQLPVDGEGLYRLAKLSPMDREYSAITVDFEEAGLKVVSVERLQNTMLLERFNQEKEHLLKLRPPDFELNEHYLYHGTQASQHCLCEEGLDHRLSFQGCYGRGIYFSDNPRKCMQYAMSTSNIDSHGTRPMILVCRVLLGESKVYDQGIKDSSLKREPEKPKAKGGWRYYDSVQGIPVDYPEYVVYDNRRSMIEYIVTFEEVGYRAPPAVTNFYQTPVPSLYKVEPIVLPIPEEKLDKMYMLCPDTDSDGSCDEHTREVERLRDHVKRGKAKRLGIPYRPPTKEEKRYERLHWKRVCYYSCPPGSPLFEMMIMKKQQEKAERKKRKAEEKAKKAAEEGKGETPTTEEEGLGAVGGSSSTIGSASEPVTSSSRGETAEDYDVENDSVAEVLSTLIADFLDITKTDDVQKARRYILDNSMDMDKALCGFYRDME